MRIGLPYADPAAVDEALGILATAERPLILAGGGGWTDEGRAALQRWAEMTHLPVACVFRFVDLMDHGSDAYVGDAGVGMAPYMKDLIRRSDVLLALGPPLRRDDD